MITLELVLSPPPRKVANENQENDTRDEGRDRGFDLLLMFFALVVTSEYRKARIQMG